MNLGEIRSVQALMAFVCEVTQSTFGVYIGFSTNEFI